MKQMIALFVVFIGLGAQVFANDQAQFPDRKIARIVVQEEAEPVEGVIELSDGSSWKWEPKPGKEKELVEWQEGDTIEIMGKRYGNRFSIALYNLTELGDLAPVYVTATALNYTNQIFLRVEEAFVDEGWFLSDLILKLSNGTFYKIDLERLSKTWEVGDWIVDCKQMKKGVMLINMTKEDYNFSFQEVEND